MFIYVTSHLGLHPLNIYLPPSINFISGSWEQVETCCSSLFKVYEINPILVSPLTQVGGLLLKDKSNFCEFFEFRETSMLSHPGMVGSGSRPDRARDAFDALFGDKKTD